MSWLHAANGITSRIRIRLMFHSLMNMRTAMSGRISEAARRLELRLGTPVLILLIGIISLTAAGQSPSPGNSTTTASESLLPRKVVVPVSVVNRSFPELSREASTGRNVTAVGNPIATRSVIYANKDTSKKVTITVDQYASASDASSAFQNAVQKSRTVAGFKPVTAANLGQDAFIGSVTQDGETHIGLGALDGTLIVGATLAGYDLTSVTTAKLVSLAREEEDAAKHALAENAQK